MLGTAPCARSAHFAVHYLDGRPAPLGAARRRPSPTPMATELSTANAPTCAPSVDDFVEKAVGGAAWLGAVVPKRHARRAVTRSLMKRQMRAAAGRVAATGGLPGGLWVVRLRSGFSREAFPSAASEALRLVLRRELDAVFADALRKCAARGRAAVQKPCATSPGAS